MPLQNSIHSNLLSLFFTRQSLCLECGVSPLTAWEIELTIVVVVHSPAIANVLLVRVVAIPIVRVAVEVVHSVPALVEAVRVVVAVVVVVVPVVAVADVHLDVRCRVSS